MAFQIGEKVKVAIGEPPLDPKAPRELFVIDRKGREHILTVDRITLKTEN